MAGIEFINGVINSGGVPSAGAGLLASRPAAGVLGRLYIGTDTNAWYRDTGTAWVTISAGVSGSAATGQATFWSSASTISGDNAFFWDNTNKRLGLGTTTPGVRLDVHGTGIQAQFNGTGTNNSFIDFQNAGTTQWRIGNFYNGAAQQLSILNALFQQNFTIFQSGNIYVGGSPLDRVGLLQITDISLIGNTATPGVTTGLLRFRNENSTGFTIAEIRGLLGPININDGILTFWTGNAGSLTEKMRITESGKIGIGYTAPAITGLAVSGSIYQGSNTVNSNFQLLCSTNFYTGGFSPNFFTYTSGPVTIPLSNTGLVFKTAATITATLPAASGINNQYYIVVLAGTVVTLNRSGSDNIINTVGATVTSLTLTGYTKILLYSDGGTTWYQLF